MIRINLLPNQGSSTGDAKLQLFAFTALLLVEIGILALVYTNTQTKLSQVQKEIVTNKAEVQKLKNEVKDAAELKKQADTLSKQLEVLAQLESQRTGPVRVLDELQAILSPPSNEEARYKQLQMNWNVEWDTKRLWLTTLTEKKRGKRAGSFEMKGGAVNADDVAEFLQRLTTSNHFKDILLDIVKAKDASAETDTGAKRKVRFVTFRLTGRLDYNGASNKNAKKAAPKKKKG